MLALKNMLQLESVQKQDEHYMRKSETSTSRRFIGAENVNYYEIRKMR